MKVPYRDLRVTDPNRKQELLRVVEKILSHGKIYLGPEHDQFEKEIAEYCQTQFAVGVSSGTDALYFALRCLDLGPGDEVILPPLSWVASLNAVFLCGATPVFVDITEDLNINAELIHEAITPKTKAILPIHFTGKLCDIKKINAIAEQHGLFVVEDAAQSFGAELDGEKAGSFGTLGCLSMNPMKLLCAYGEAGVVVTDNEQLAKRIKSLRHAGTINKDDCHEPSFNGRLDTIQAGMLSINLKYLQSKLDRLKAIATHYNENLKHLVICPQDPSTNHVYYTYTILTQRRDELKEYLASKNIETQIQHPILMPNQTAYRHLPRYNIPVAEKVVDQILCLPNHEHLSDEQVEYVIACIKEFLGKDQ